jgi:outer membrane protein assembly factor BamB
MAVIAALAMGAPRFAAAGIPGSYPGAVLTHHYDNFRTGWDQAEPILTQANAGQIAQLASVALDGQVDAQPLYAPNVTISAGNIHNVLYVVTSNDSVYAIDADTGAVLIKRSLGTPVPESALPQACPNNDKVVGITSTPVIDPLTARLYLIAYTYTNSKPAYTLHALNTVNLLDSLPPKNITATAHLTNGTSYTFNPASARQRAALLLSNGNIYAGFSSFCDVNGRGWMLLWNKNTLQLNSHQMLMNRIPSAPDGLFLNSIWMAGAGPAGDTDGSVFVATGNSDTSGTTWNNVSNLEESVVRYGSDLSEALDHYTPANEQWGQKVDDPIDADVGAGGVTLLPTQGGPFPYMMVAGGKTTGLLLLNRYQLGGYGDAELDEHFLGYCWCGESYYTDPAGFGHIVASFGQNVTDLTLRVTPSPHLTNPITSPPLMTGEDPGFFTTVSSNGTTAGTQVVWAVTRPIDSNPAYIYLYAFNPLTGAQLVRRTAGTWPNSNSDSNIVPTVANGKVYVASYHQLLMFGLTTTPGQTQTFVPPPLPPEAPLPPGVAHEISGTVVHAGADTLTLKLRSGRSIKVNVVAAKSNAAENRRVGQGLLVRGDYDGDNFRAVHVIKLKPQLALWPRDR